MNKPEKYINESGKECYKNVTKETKLSDLEFHEVFPRYEEDIEYALHTNVSSFTVLDRVTGFGWRDTETEFTNEYGGYWLATGNCDVGNSGSLTIQEAIDFVESHAI